MHSISANVRNTGHRTHLNEVGAHPADEVHVYQVRLREEWAQAHGLQGLPPAVESSEGLMPRARACVQLNLQLAYREHREHGRRRRRRVGVVRRRGRSVHGLRDVVRDERGEGVKLGTFDVNLRSPASEPSVT